MEIKTTIDMLTADSVSIQTQKHIIVDGVNCPIGQPHRRAYINSEHGRIEMAQELPDPYFSAVMQIWGDQATVEEEKLNGHDDL